MKQRRRLMAILVAFAMLIGGIPMGVFDVHATDGHNCGYISSEEIQVTEFTSDTTELEADKYYYLNSDITLKADVTVKGTVYLCLNGHDIEMGLYRFMKADESAYIFILDCTDTPGDITGTVQANLDLESGKVYYLTPDKYELLDDLDIQLYSDNNKWYEYTTRDIGGSVWEYEFKNVYIYEYQKDETMGNVYSYTANSLFLKVKEENEASEQIMHKDTYNYDAEGYEDHPGLVLSEPYKESYNEESSLNCEFTINGKYPKDLLIVAGSIIGEGYNSDWINSSNNVALYVNGNEIITTSWTPFIDGDIQLNAKGDQFVELYKYAGGKEQKYYLELDNEDYILKLIEKKEDDTAETRTVVYYNYTCVQAEVIEKVNVGVEALEVGASLPEPTLIENGDETEIHDVSWTANGEAVDKSEVVKAGTKYRATITLSPKDGYAFRNSVTTGYLNDIAIGEGSEYGLTEDGYYYIVYEETTPEAESIKSIASIDDISLTREEANASDDAIKKALPETVKTTTSEGEKTASILWDESSITYDEDNLDEQTITVSGEVQLTDGITNPDNITTNVSVKVTVAAAPQVEAPTIEFTSEDVSGSTHYNYLSFKLATKTEDAKIYYSTDGSSSAPKTEYTGEVTIKATEGLAQKIQIKAYAKKDGMKDSEYFEETVYLRGDSKPPEITISTEKNTWKSFLSKITFGLFFKESQTVEISAVDKLSDIGSIEYFVSNEVYTEAQLKSDSSITWTTYSDKFSLDPKGKYIIYARATDTSKYGGGPKTGYACSNGIVLYSDSEAVTESLTYKKLVTEEDAVAEVKLNDNTINQIKVGDTALTANSDYTVSDGNKITFDKSYLEKLDAGKHTVTVSYNPLGVTYKEADGNEAPATTTLTLNIIGSQKNKDSSITVDANEDGEFGTEGDETYIKDPEGAFIEVTPNDDGSYTDENGTIYIPVDSDDEDKDGDTFIEVIEDEENEGVFEDEEGNKYVKDPVADNARFVKVIESVEVTVEKPVAKEEFASDATVAENAEYTAEVLTWKQGDEAAGETADFNTEYIAEVKLAAKDNYAFVDGLTTGKINDEDVEFSIDDNKLIGSIPFKTDKVMLHRISALSEIIKPNRTSVETLKDALPKKVDIETDDGTKEADVTWKTDEFDAKYVVNKLEEQEFEITGTVILPDDIRNDNEVDLVAKQKFVINEAPTVEKPTIAVTEGEGSNGVYTTDVTVEITTETAGAAIYYTTDGSDPFDADNTSRIEYTGSFKLCGEEGEGDAKTVSYNIRAYAVKEAMFDSEVSEQTSISINIPVEYPNVEISVKDNKWKELLNNITFKKFFKETQQVTIEATDNYSGIDTIEYYVADRELEIEELINARIAWNTYSDGGFSIKPNSKSVIYAKATDKAGNMNIVNTQGIVLYTDSSATKTDYQYIQDINDDLVKVEVKFNGNTIDEIKNGDTVIDADSYQADYDNGTVTFERAYLDSLDGGNNVITIAYDPMGQAYVDSEVDNEAPLETVVSLKVINTKKNEDGSVTTDEDNDGDFTDEEETYLPVDTDEDGKADEYIEVEPNDDGSYTDEDGNKYLPDQDGDDVPEPDTDGDDIYEGTNEDVGNDYITDRDGDGVPEPDTDSDGVFEGTDDGDTYIGVDEDRDGDIDEIIEADKNEGDGTYEDENGNTYIPADTDKDGYDDEFIDVTPNEDGSYTDDNGTPDDSSDDKTYIGVDADKDGKTDYFVEAEKDEDTGAYEDKDGNTYIPVDTDNDGKKDEFIEVEPNKDGSFEDRETGEIYIPVDNDGDGKADEYIKATPNGDGTYTDEDGRIYESDENGIFVEFDIADDSESKTGDDMNLILWFMIMMTAAGAAVVTRKVKA